MVMLKIPLVSLPLILILILILLLLILILILGVPRYTSPSKLYYDFSPVPGWRFISLDSYDVSLIGASSAENKITAHHLLSENNPNDLNISGSWFNNLPFDKYRWVPYNGGLSSKQIMWLDDVVQKSKKNNEKLIIFSHQPIVAVDKPQSLMWNCEEVKKVISKGNVVAFLAGHDHDGQFDLADGVLHMVPTARIEVAENEQSFGYISVYSNDRIELNWTGTTPTKTRKAWASVHKF
jgi:manganese-dependent ADP-ribose/CDP-alcohol diphosphatase